MKKNKYRKNRTKRRRRKNKKLEIMKYILIAVLFVLFIVLAIAIIGIMKQRQDTSNKIVITETQTEDKIQESTEIQEKTEEIEPKIAYPTPNYDFKQEVVEVEIPGLTKEYTIAWVSDVHMVTDIEASDDVMEEFMETIKNRYNTFQTTDGVPAEELWPEIVKFINYEEFDGIILGGDIMDYCSVSNMNNFMEEYEKINKSVPLMYIRADHDYGFWYGGENFTEPMAQELHRTIDGDELEDKYLDFGEFIVVGVNRSVKNMTEDQYHIVKELMERGKPVIIATHVPYESKVDATLEELSMQVRNKVYYWGGGDYIAYEPTTGYFDSVYSEDTVVEQVLAGHLHAKWDGMLTEQVTQHIFSPAFTGTVGVIHVKAAKE